MIHCMIDLETLGTAPGSVILSIGAVLFDPSAPPESCITKEFYCVVGRADSERRGLAVDQSTLDWWKSQSPEAREVLTAAEDPEQFNLLPDALEMLATFIPTGSKVWSNGANFDQPLLDVAYRLCEIPLPWKFWDSRCYRTLVALVPNERSMRVANNSAHNALADAQWQAQHMVKVAQHAGIKIL